MVKRTRIEEVRFFWENNPLCVYMIPHEPGTREFFEQFDKLREENEPVEFSYRLHEYPKFKGKKVLDIGCGNGYVLSRYAIEGAHTFGIDLTTMAVALSMKRFTHMGLEGAFIQANAETLPFKDSSFDCVSSMGVLHHTPETEKAIGEVYRVLKPGGRLILMFYYRNSIFNRYTLPMRRLLNPKNWFKSHQKMLNDVDGYGNPKGDVYSKAEMEILLGDKFRQLEMFTGWVEPEMFFPIGFFIPRSILRLIASKWGFFLYIKGWK